MTVPSNRKEAVAQIIETGFTISAMLAVAKAFPLDESEAEDVDDLLRRMDDPWVSAEVDRYLRAWGSTA